MRNSFFATCLLFLMVLANAAHADGLIVNLPVDGTWATYQMDSAVSLEGEVKEKGSSELRVASVGKVTERGQPCRWIEISISKTTKETKDDAAEGGKRTRTYPERVFKLLIPEKKLSKGQAPLEHVIRGWEKNGKAPPRKFSGHSVKLPWLPTLLYGPLQNARALPKKEVESKLGKISCEGVAGTLQINDPAQGRVLMKFEDRIHPDSPFGLVNSSCNFEIKRLEGKGEKGEVTLEMEWNVKLTDFGKNAKSIMPDSQ